MTDVQNEFNEYVCNNCKTKFLTNRKNIIKNCFYCNSDSINILNDNKNILPNRIISFKTSKEEIREILYRHIINNDYFPEELKNNLDCFEIKGIYVPYYAANYDIRICSNGYSKNSHRNIPIKFNVEFTEKALICSDASLKLDDSVMASLEPFDYNQLQKVEAMVFDEYYAELPSDSIDEIEKRIDNRIIRYSYARAMEEMPYKYHASGEEIYDFCRTTDFEFVLLPVWFISYNYQNDNYTYVINGQTGKIVGDNPEDPRIDKTKKAYLIGLIVFVSLLFLLEFLWFCIFGYLSIKTNSSNTDIWIILSIFIGMICIIPCIFFAVKLLLFGKKIKSSSGIINLYNIPVRTWERIYKEKKPKYRSFAADTFLLHSLTYNSNAVSYKRYKNGEYIEDIDILSINKYINASKKLSYTKNFFK